MPTISDLGSLILKLAILLILSIPLTYPARKSVEVHNRLFYFSATTLVIFSFSIATLPFAFSKGIVREFLTFYAIPKTVIIAIQCIDLLGACAGLMMLAVLWIAEFSGKNTTTSCYKLK